MYDKVIEMTLEGVQYELSMNINVFSMLKFIHKGFKIFGYKNGIAMKKSVMYIIRATMAG